MRKKEVLVGRVIAMTERDTHFAVPAHHRDFQPQPHHSRNRDPGFERVIRDREAYYERDNREKERENRDRSERLDRDKEREREKDTNNKDRARDRDKERERDREREREQQLYGSDHRNNNNGVHGHVGGGPSRETGPPPPPYRSRGEEGFDQEGGGREAGNSRYDREDRYVTAGLRFVLFQKGLN